MQFQQIIGQGKTKKVLRSMISSDRMSHALVFLGPEGCGKLALALAFAQYVLCTDKQEKVKRTQNYRHFLRIRPLFF